MGRDPISRIEAAIVERLHTGLGNMVRSVENYGGELDGALPAVIRRFPAAWVTFKGVLQTRPMNTGKSRYDANGRFVVLVGTQTVRSEQAGRRGGPRVNEVGTYQLIYAVRRLLSNQDLGLSGVDYLQPGTVRTLFNGALGAQAVSVFAVEFDTSWTERPLEAGRWPEPNPEDVGNPEAIDPDLIFVEYAAQTDEPHPALSGIQLDYRLPDTSDTQPPDATDVVLLNKEK